MPDETGKATESTRIQVHGTAVEVGGLGILLLGDSGAGKSEAALELISRGHQVIADDAVVLIRSPGSEEIKASACKATKDLLEIRGLGIIDIRGIFGHKAISEGATISLYIRLNKGETAAGTERLGISWKEEKLAGVFVPGFEIPVRSGRSIPVLIETAVRILVAGRGDS